MMTPDDAEITHLGQSRLGSVDLITGDAVTMPLPSALRLLNELARRSLDSDAPVANQFARVRSGAAAWTAHAYLSGAVMGQLRYASPAQRILVAAQIWDYLDHHSDAVGLESVLAATVNATWPILPDPGVAALTYRLQELISVSPFTAKLGLTLYDPLWHTLSHVAAQDLEGRNLTVFLDDDWRKKLREAAHHVDVAAIEGTTYAEINGLLADLPIDLGGGDLGDYLERMATALEQLGLKPGSGTDTIGSLVAALSDGPSFAIPGIVGSAEQSSGSIQSRAEDYVSGDPSRRGPLTRADLDHRGYVTVSERGFGWGGMAIGAALGALITKSTWGALGGAAVGAGAGVVVAKGVNKAIAATKKAIHDVEEAVDPPDPDESVNPDAEQPINFSNVTIGQINALLAKHGKAPIKAGLGGVLVNDGITYTNHTPDTVDELIDLVRGSSRHEAIEFFLIDPLGGDDDPRMSLIGPVADERGTHSVGPSEVERWVEIRRSRIAYKLLTGYEHSSIGTKHGQVLAD